MLKSKLTALKDFILEHNTYLSKGYDNVYMDQKVGLIHDGEPVFPADNLGDYFYLRLPERMTFDYNGLYKASDCGNEPGIAAQMILVACVRKASPDNLILNLASTLNKFKEAEIKITGALFESEAVLLQELAKMKDENVFAALQKLDKDYTIVSIGFTITASFDFIKLNCIVNPCSC